MTDREPTPILVTGASGKTGRRVAARLTAAGHAVRGVGRTSTPPLQWGEPDTWTDVLAPDAGDRPVRAAYLAYAPDAGFPGADAVLGAFARAARDAGVGRLVVLTGRGEPGAARSERAVVASGVPTVIVRSAFFAQGFTEDLLAAAVESGVIRLPAGTTAEPFVDVEDLADVAVAGLTGRLDVGVHELTGPRSLTLAEVADVLSRTSGRSVTYQPVTPQEFRADLLALGLGEDDATGLAALLTEVLDGRNTAPTDGVRRALGREPRDFAAAMAAAAASAGAW